MKLTRILVLLSLIISQLAFGADYTSAQRFKSGDVVSADVLNDILDRLDLTLKSAKASDLVGTWDLTQTICPSGGVGNCSDLSVDGADPAVDNLYRQRSDTVMFSDDGDDTYSYQTASYCAFVRSGAGNTPCSGAYAIVDGRFIIDSGGNAAFVLRKISDTRYLISMMLSGSASFNIVRLEKKLLPPSAPTSLELAAQSGSISLSWTVGDTTATGYDIQRKITFDGTYASIGTSTDVGFTDLSVTAGTTYWYRVFATNANGTSIGSNVVKLTYVETTE
jgi:hypothetical protein